MITINAIIVRTLSHKSKREERKEDKELKNFEATTTISSNSPNFSDFVSLNTATKQKGTFLLVYNFGYLSEIKLNSI
jgi:hypothetical protein